MKTLISKLRTLNHFVDGWFPRSAVRFCEWLFASAAKRAISG